DDAAQSPARRRAHGPHPGRAARGQRHRQPRPARRALGGCAPAVLGLRPTLPLVAPQDFFARVTDTLLRACGGHPHRDAPTLPNTPYCIAVSKPTGASARRQPRCAMPRAKAAPAAARAKLAKPAPYEVVSSLA